MGVWIKKQLVKGDEQECTTNMCNSTISDGNYEESKGACEPTMDVERYV